MMRSAMRRPIPVNCDDKKRANPTDDVGKTISHDETRNCVPYFDAIQTPLTRTSSSTLNDASDPTIVNDMRLRVTASTTAYVLSGLTNRIRVIRAVVCADSPTTFSNGAMIPAIAFVFV